jgi:hypothetical protein
MKIAKNIFATIGLLFVALMVLAAIGSQLPSETIDRSGPVYELNI